MALWPFAKKKDERPIDSVEAVTPEAEAGAPADAEAMDSIPAAPVHDAVGGDSGPFDGDTNDIEEFDFSDFSAGVLNLGSIKIALPKKSQVQVEMGEAGPKMVHLVTEFGRVTPVAFAAPRSAGQWEESNKEILQGMKSEGLTVETEQGPWGTEIVASGENGVVRVIGVDGPRWMLRMTATAPFDRAEGLRDLAREITARSFVYRGEDPVLAGNALPVVLPQQLVAQVQQAMQQRAQDNQGKPQGQSAQPVTPQEQQEVNDTAQTLRGLTQNSDDVPSENNPEK